MQTKRWDNIPFATISLLFISTGLVWPHSLTATDLSRIGWCALMILLLARIGLCCVLPFLYCLYKQDPHEVTAMTAIVACNNKKALTFLVCGSGHTIYLIYIGHWFIGGLWLTTSLWLAMMTSMVHDLKPLLSEQPAT